MGNKSSSTSSTKFIGRTRSQTFSSSRSRSRSASTVSNISNHSSTSTVSRDFYDSVSRKIKKDEQQSVWYQSERREKQINISTSPQKSNIISEMESEWEDDENTTDYFTSLSSEVIMEIAYHLTISDIISLESTCSTFRKVISSDKLLWRGLYFERWLTVPFLPSEEELSWKNLFALRMACINSANKALSYIPENRVGIELHKAFLSKFAKLTEKEISSWQEAYETHYGYPYEGRYIDLGLALGVFHNLSWGKSMSPNFEIVEREAKKAAIRGRVHVSDLIISYSLARFTKDMSGGKCLLELSELFEVECEKKIFTRIRRIRRTRSTESLSFSFKRNPGVKTRHFPAVVSNERTNKRLSI